MHFVYLIKSKENEWCYVGSTSNIEKRLKEHNAGQVRSTKFRLPYELIYIEEFKTVQDARQREKKIKQSRYLKQSIIKTALSSNG